MKLNKMETIKSATLTSANKSHQCMFCTQSIEKGSKYYKSVHKLDEVYTWRTHVHCAELASKLGMYDNTDDGLTTDMFIEFVKNEYQDIMSNAQNELYEINDFIIPKLKEQLQFVLSHYGIIND